MAALTLYEPLPKQKKFHASRTRQRLLIAGNRAGKTLAACVEVARAVMNEDPHKKYPKEGVCYIVGKDGKHLGDPCYRLLFKPGVFQIVRNQRGRWAVYNPNNKAHRQNRHTLRKAPPLIPRRYVESIAWEDKKASIPKLIKLTTGWELHFFSSLGEPPQGSRCDLAWFDEEVVNPQWYPEISARLVDRRGLFIWSATPQAGTEALYDLHTKALKEAVNKLPERSVEEFFLHIRENLFQTPKAIEEFIATLPEHQRQVRVEGQFAVGMARCFPEFNRGEHVCGFFAIPSNWTRYLAVDPGRQVCAVLFLAMPPPFDEKHKNYAYLYNELYLQDADAEQFGDNMTRLCEGQAFYKFLIDGHEGRKASSETGRRIEDVYSEVLRKRRIFSETTGSGFEWGSDTPRADVEVARLWLIPQNGKPPKLKVFEDKCPNFLEEVERYRYKRDVNGRPTQDPESGPYHLMDCFRYLVQASPAYQPPKKKPEEPYGVWKQVLDGRKNTTRGQVALGK